VKRYDQVAAFILAGGASSRMGREKGLLEFGGLPLIARTVQLLEPLVSAVTIVGPPECYVALGLRAIADQDVGIQEGKGTSQGPLAGIASALATTGVPWNLVLACDLPYLTDQWLDWMLARAIGSNAQVVLPQTSRGLEPLAAVYRHECAAPIAESLARGVRKVTDALAEFRIEFVFEHEWRGIDPDGRILRNMNTPADYEEARKWWDAKKAAAGSRVKW
jgi:molybdopterin-guanine dinucleotide biosynthesis protein A